MKEKKYPPTPGLNCMYCRWYNHVAFACSAPNSDKIAVFNPVKDKDCILLKYEKTENPKINSAAFVAEYCVGKKCPYYYKTINLCTRPSKCPYKEKIKTIFDNVIIDD